MPKRRPRKLQKWDVQVSFLARNTHNPIRDIFERLHVKPNPNKEYISLSVGDPTTFGNLTPPDSMFQAVRDCIDLNKSRSYCSTNGLLKAREAVAKYSSHQGPIEPNDVIICSGCTHAIELVISVLAEPGQNILMPCPGHMVYKTLSDGMGIEVKFYKLLPDQKWKVDLEDLESKIDDKTALIVVNNPSNPCGSVYDEEHLSEIINIASRNHVPILADEVYEDFVFSGHKHVPLSSLSKDVPVFTCSGITKRFLVPGWRLGWVIVHDRQNILGKEIREGLINLSLRIMGANTLIQHALPIILRVPQDYFEKMMLFIEEQAELAVRELKKAPGLCPIMPHGAMYMMVQIKKVCFPGFTSDVEFIEALVTQESVLCLPGQCFGCGNFMRIVLTVPEDILLEACTRIRTFCEEHFVAPTPNVLTLQPSNGNISNEDISNDTGSNGEVSSEPGLNGEVLNKTRSNGEISNGTELNGQVSKETRSNGEISNGTGSNKEIPNGTGSNRNGGVTISK